MKKLLLLLLLSFLNTHTSQNIEDAIIKSDLAAVQEILQTQTFSHAIKLLPYIDLAQETIIAQRNKLESEYYKPNIPWSRLYSVLLCSASFFATFISFAPNQTQQSKIITRLAAAGMFFSGVYFFKKSNTEYNEYYDNLKNNYEKAMRIKQLFFNS